MMTYEAMQHYRRLRDDVDRQAGRLAAMHAGQMHCQKKCTDCCINLTVWPVEFYAILEDVKAADSRPVFDVQASCGFLKEGLCQLYAFRPLICRTHGLPLVYLDDSQDEPVYGVTFCEKNFPAADTMDFDSDNTLNMDDINERLARLQTEFSSAGGPKGSEPNGRIALSRLIEYVQENRSCHLQ